MVCLATTYSPTVVVPSALERFTVEFGMGSSGGAPLKSPGKRRMFWPARVRRDYMRPLAVQNDLVLSFRQLTEVSID